MTNRDKTARCITCQRDFHPLGIARHRASHRDKRERCEIDFSDGSTVTYYFDRPPPRVSFSDWQCPPERNAGLTDNVTG